MEKRPPLNFRKAAVYSSRKSKLQENSFIFGRFYRKLCTFAQKSEIMKYRIKKETKPKLPTYGKYKAVAVHDQTYGTGQITKEVAREMGCHAADVYGIMLGLSTIINRHLRNGDKVDNLKDFKAKKHIRGARLHFIPESQNGSPELYKDLKFEKDKTSPED